MTNMMNKRFANLDLLRASAILMVVIFHVVQRWPEAPSALATATKYGALGVDLFFVLSGWLVGSLLWRELQSKGNVQVFRFYGRRALRTMPPYLVALSLAFLGVHFSRKEPFDFGYLVFAQNFYEKIPFFLVSWSLCVEEHFYVALSALAMLQSKLLTKSFWIVACGLACVPAFLRFAIYVPEPRAFGFSETASHIRFEGLLLGVLASYMRYFSPNRWDSISRYAPALFICSILGGVATLYSTDRIQYSLFGAFIALGFVAILIIAFQSRPTKVASSRIIYWIAVTSYSVYLTHAMAIEASERLLGVAVPSALRLATYTVTIALAGTSFYFLVERTSLRLRDRFLPNR